MNLVDEIRKKVKEKRDKVAAQQEWARNMFEQIAKSYLEFNNKEGVSVQRLIVKSNPVIEISKAGRIEGIVTCDLKEGVLLFDDSSCKPSCKVTSEVEWQAFTDRIINFMVDLLSR